MRKITSCCLACLVVALLAPPAVGHTASERAAATSLDPMSLEIQPAEISAVDERVLATSKGLGGTTWMTIPAAAFVNDGSDSSSYVFRRFGGYMQASVTPGSTCAQAPVYLPHGAVLDQIWASVKDSDADDDVVITLKRVAHDAYQSSDTMVSISTTSSSPLIQKPNFGAQEGETIPFAEVDYGSYSYYLTTCLTDTTWLYSVRLVYTETEIFIDGFESGDTSAWSSATKDAQQSLRVGSDDLPLQRIGVPGSAAFPADVQDELRHKALNYGSPLVIPAADFTYDGLYAGELKDSTEGYISASGFGEVLAQAPVYLPTGVSVTSVCSVVVDNFAGGTQMKAELCDVTPDVSTWMYSGDNTLATYGLMTSTATTGAGTGFQLICDDTPDSPDIVYPDKQYYLVSQLCSTEHHLYAVLIYYTTP